MINSLILYFQFFTRVPIPVEIEEPLEGIRSGVRYFTLFGLILGCIEMLAFWLLQLLVGSGMAWILTLFFDVCITGGFHLDALSDMADGLFSSRNKERMLAIMKDSRVGSNGVLAVVFYYLLIIFSFYTILPNITIYQQLFIVLLLNVVGKNGISLLFYNMRYAGDNPEGSGTVFVNTKTADIGIAQAFTLIVLLLFLGRVGVISYGVNVLVASAYRWLVLKKVDGFNGDTLGAGSPLSQVSFLLTLVWLGGWL
ncbi:adenosylcobinamide-GDP ribazoletransferase [Enterococcus sp. AZ109]|uniref:adenosylcobinamide-GDP ribazoletransferase n=1 Tax=Enterococcus sp. AZ109 TaxID=2774634 RepID=UPI003F25DA54